MVLAKILVLAALATVCTSVTVTTFPCSGVNPVGSLVSVDVDPCPAGSSGGCIIYRGTNATITVTFKAGSSDSDPTAWFYGYVLGIKTPYPAGSSADVCNNLKSGNCPLQSGSEYVYTGTFQVLQSYPTISLPVQIDITTGLASSGANEICFLIPITIK